MYHSLIFQHSDNGTVTTKNTWDDWHLIPSSRPSITQPTVNYKFVDVPGRDGSLDMSNYLTGAPSYSDRTGNISFYVANENEYGASYGNWATRKSEIATFLDGRKQLKMILEDDPNYYYLGRCYMKDWQPGENFSTVTIEYRVAPYKYAVSNDQAVIG